MAIERLSPRYGSLVLAFAFAISLAYEIWRATSHAGTSEYDAFELWWIGFYGIGFGMAGLAWKDLRGGWWIILVVSTLLWIVGAVGYNPVILMARSPGFVDHLESATYMGLLMLTIGVAIERLRLWNRAHVG